MESFRHLISSPIFLSALTAWFFAQFIKALISIVRYRSKLAKRDLLLTLIWTTGGMPSSHSATVMALTTAVGFKVGFDSPLFMVSFFFSFMAIRDALGVRQAAGNQARSLNQIIEDANQRWGTNHKPVKEIHGHKIPEVVVGCLLGIFLATAFCNL
jgi:acid phosphatase family membrane protein YuiD